MDGNEHRDIGDAAAGGALVNLGGEPADEQFWLGYGDVMALSGDYFRPESSREIVGDQRTVDGTLVGGTLFSLAPISGDKGTSLGTRDEIICALRVMALDEAFVDRRFGPGGRFADFGRGRRGSSGDVERRVRDRYLQLAATNDDHFVAPGGVTHERDPAAAQPFGSASLAYRHHHQVAIELALRLGHTRGDQTRAMAREAAAQHFLTDAVTAGHLRTPVAQIRRFWHARYPAFWENLQRAVAAQTASTLRELAWALRRLPDRLLRDATLSALRRRTSRYPELSVGDFLARLFHDWDNRHGIAVEAGGVVFGDGHVDRGVTRQIALAAVRAGIDDIEAAFDLGVAGRHLGGEPLYQAVRAATGAPRGMFLAETKIPRPAAANPPQNWRAADLDALWDTPIVGRSGTTVGEALAEMMAPDGQFIGQLDRLGRGLVEPYGLLAVPVLGDWLADKGRQAYHRGFVEPLAEDPRRAIFSVIHGTAVANGRARSTDRGCGASPSTGSQERRSRPRAEARHPTPAARDAGLRQRSVHRRRGSPQIPTGPAR